MESGLVVRLAIKVLVGEPFDRTGRTRYFSGKDLAAPQAGRFLADKTSFGRAQPRKSGQVEAERLTIETAEKTATVYEEVQRGLPAAGIAESCAQGVSGVGESILNLSPY